MTGPQLTFLAISAGLPPLLTWVFYPGVRLHARTARDSLIASFMAAALLSVSGALFVSGLFHVALRLGA